MAIVVVPTPPLGLNTETMRPPPDPPIAPAPLARLLERWKCSASASTRPLSSARSKGLVMTSSAPASSSAIRFSRSADWATASTGTVTDAGSARSAAMMDATVVSGGTWSRMTRL